MAEVSKGLEGVVVGQTKLSHVDGDQGVLIYRGYNIDEIAQCSFEEICHLLLQGTLPNQRQLREVEDFLKSSRQIPLAIRNFIFQSPALDHPMSMLRSAVSMLSGYLPEIDPKDEKALKERALYLTAQVCVISALIGRAKQGKPYIEPRTDINHASNFLYLLNDEVPDSSLEKALEVALVLHADHGFNVSTFTARVVVSSLSDMISGMVAAIGSLKGPLHGGANVAVMEMLFEIGTLENLAPWLDQALASKRKIMGFGHRVYKTLDPRAKHLKRMSEEWTKKAKETKWFQMSDALQKMMKERKNLNANVDFYSASTYYSMGIRPDMYTVIFAVARSIGWACHMMEQLQDNRIIRPDAEYMGPLDLKYVSLEKRLSV